MGRSVGSRASQNGNDQFLVSLLDILSCGFGAALLLFMTFAVVRYPSSPPLKIGKVLIANADFENYGLNLAARVIPPAGKSGPGQLQPFEYLMLFPESNGGSELSTSAGPGESPVKCDGKPCFTMLVYRGLRPDRKQGAVSANIYIVDPAPGTWRIQYWFERVPSYGLYLKDMTEREWIKRDKPVRVKTVFGDDVAYCRRIGARMALLGRTRPVKKKSLCAPYNENADSDDKLSLEKENRSVIELFYEVPSS